MLGFEFAVLELALGRRPTGRAVDEDDVPPTRMFFLPGDDPISLFKLKDRSAPVAVDLETNPWWLGLFRDLADLDDLHC